MYVHFFIQQIYFMFLLCDRHIVDTQGTKQTKMEKISDVKLKSLPRRKLKWEGNKKGQFPYAILNMVINLHKNLHIKYSLIKKQVVKKQKANCCRLLYFVTWTVEETKSRYWWVLSKMADDRLNRRFSGISQA